MQMEKAHVLHPVWDPSILTQDVTQEERLVCAWEDETQRAEKIIGRVRENFMFVRIDARQMWGI
jgi:hypothetical protein